MRTSILNCTNVNMNALRTDLVSVLGCLDRDICQVHVGAERSHTLSHFDEQTVGFYAGHLAFNDLLQSAQHRSQVSRGGTHMKVLTTPM